MGESPLATENRCVVEDEAVRFRCKKERLTSAVVGLWHSGAPCGAGMAGKKKRGSLTVAPFWLLVCFERKAVLHSTN